MSRFNCTLYTFIFSRKLLAKQTFEEEMKLFDAFMEAGVYITPSQAFESPEPGWFRIIFSTETTTLRLGEIFVYITPSQVFENTEPG